MTTDNLIKLAYQDYAGGVSQDLPIPRLSKNLIPRNIIKLEAPKPQQAKVPQGRTPLPQNEDRPPDMPYYKNFAQPWKTVSGTGFGRAYWNNPQDPYSSL